MNATYGMPFGLKCLAKLRALIEILSHNSNINLITIFSGCSLIIELELHLISDIFFYETKILCCFNILFFFFTFSYTFSIFKFT